MSRKKRREQLLAELATGVGGSEIHNLWNLEPYGCRRRLWYEKTGAPPDFARALTKDMERGIELEPIVARIYGRETGRKLVAGRFHRDREQPWLIVHPDRLIKPLQEDRWDSRGLLEIKCPTVRKFLECKRTGLPEAWVLQVQHGLGVTRLAWGSFAVFSAELWELLHFDIPADLALIEKIQAEASRFWQTVENGPSPDRLAPDDQRCQTCSFRTQCQGAALLARVGPDAGPDADHPRDDALVPLLREYSQARALQREAEVLVDAARAPLEAAIGERQRLVSGGFTVHFAAREEVRLDTASLRSNYPVLCEQFETRRVVRPLRVYAPK